MGYSTKFTSRCISTKATQCFIISNRGVLGFNPPHQSGKLMIYICFIVFLVSLINATFFTFFPSRFLPFSLFYCDEEDDDLLLADATDGYVHLAIEVQHLIFCLLTLYFPRIEEKSGDKVEATRTASGFKAQQNKFLRSVTARITVSQVFIAFLRLQSIVSSSLNLIYKSNFWHSLKNYLLKD